MGDEEGRCETMHCTFALMVTGRGEQDFLPSLFRSLMDRTNCSFSILSRIGQRGPITSEARRLRMVGSGQAIPTSDEQELGMPARRFLRDKPTHYLLLIDDIELDRRPQIAEVFTRYRKALDTMLRPDEGQRAAVHFFANMLEAYYFADSRAVNQVLGRGIIARDYDGDPEDIPHPKNELKAICAGFDERRDGALIVRALDIDHVLSTPETCRYLRSLFGWCVEQVLVAADVWDEQLATRYRLADGHREELTRSQVAHRRQ